MQRNGSRNPIKLLIISGRSGSGKSICLRCLEDMGFYVVDNLPFVLLPSLLENLSHSQVAVSLDSRNLPTDPNALDEVLNQVFSAHPDSDLLYLDADDNTLLKRYSETRRKHPLSGSDISLQEAIAKEIVLLEPVVNRADLIIDTRDTSADELMRLVRNRVTSKDTDHLAILFQSFGFKYGIPNDADYIFDIRCLPNPYWELSLRELNGQDTPVIDYLSKKSKVNEMQASITRFLEEWIPKFKADKRSYLTIGIGCTGGQHRSVYMVERLAKHFKPVYNSIQIRHRELKSSSAS